MMRRPSTAADLYAWHRAAVAGESPAIHPDLPECGWFKTRLVKGGPWVPARIWCERDIDPVTGDLTAPERTLCEVDGMRRDPARMWTYLKPISRTEFDALSARREAIPEMAATMARLDLTRKAISP